MTVQEGTQSNEASGQELVLSVFAQPLREYLNTLEPTETKEAFEAASLVMAKYLFARGKKDADLLDAAHNDAFQTSQLDIQSPFLVASVNGILIELTLEFVREGRVEGDLEAIVAGCLAEFLPTLEDAVGRWSQDGESPAHTPVAISGVLHELVVLAMRGAGLSWEERFTVARRAASMAERTLPFREDDERAAFTSRFGDLLRRLDTVAAREHHALPFDDPTPAEDFASRLLDPNHAAAPTQEPDAIDRFTDMVGEHELLGVSADTVATIRAQVSPHAWGRLVFGMTSWAMASQDESPDPDALVRTARYAASLGTDPVFAGPFAPRLDATIHGMLSWASAAAIHHQIPGDIYDNHDELASSLLLTLKLGEAWQWLGLPRERRLAGGDEGIQSLPDVWSAALLTGALF